MVADMRKHLMFAQIAKINKKVFIPNFFQELISLPVRFVILCFVWISIFKVLQSDTINGFSLWEMIIYYFVYSIITHITMYYRSLPRIIWTEITEGNLSKFICRPISYIKYHFFYGLGYTYYSAIICISLVLLISLIFLHSNSLIITSLFLAAVFNGVVITFFLYANIGFLTFWTESIFGYRDLFVHVSAIISGGVIPLSFMPQSVQRMSLFLPFRYTIYEPIQILFAHYSIKDSVFALFMQIIMILFLSCITNMVWKIGIKKYEAQEG